MQRFFLFFLLFNAGDSASFCVHQGSRTLLLPGDVFGGAASTTMLGLSLQSRSGEKNTDAEARRDFIAFHII
jgi:hypothetical protein